MKIDQYGVDHITAMSIYGKQFGDTLEVIAACDLEVGWGVNVIFALYDIIHISN